MIARRANGNRRREHGDGGVAARKKGKFESLKLEPKSPLVYTIIYFFCPFLARMYKRPGTSKPFKTTRLAAGLYQRLQSHIIITWMLEESKCSKNRPALTNKYHRTSQGMPPLNTQSWHSWPPSLVSAAESCSKRYAAKNTEATTCRRLQHFVGVFGVPSTNPAGYSWECHVFSLRP